MSSFSDLSKNDLALVAEMGGRKAMVKVPAKDLRPGDLIMVNVARRSGKGLVRAVSLRRITKTVRAKVRQDNHWSPRTVVKFTPPLPAGRTFVCCDDDLLDTFPMNGGKPE